MLAGKGFDNVINMSGGIKAWNGETALGDELQGLELFGGDETAETTLVVAYSMEKGLREFYLAMAPKVQNPKAQSLFTKMADIELKHQDRIFAQYREHTGQALDREIFEQQTLQNVIEGGLTTDEYIQRFQPSLESPIDIISLAMSIEAQALDLYQRAADRSNNPNSRQALQQIADEELGHFEKLKELHEKWQAEGKWPETIPVEVKGTRVKDVFKDTLQKIDQVVQTDEDELGAIRKAMDFEAKGASYYRKLRDEATDPKVKGFFGLLASIEHQHYSSLKETEKYLMNPVSWDIKA